MNQRRPKIPADIKREVLVEAGHKCSIHNCEHTATEFHHIVPWSQCKSHQANNIIALCPNCHTRADKGEIDKTALHMYKERNQASFRFGHSIPTVTTEHGVELTEECEATSDHPSYTIAIEYPRFAIQDAEANRELAAYVYGIALEEALKFRSHIDCFQHVGLNGDDTESPHKFLRGSYAISVHTNSLVSFRFKFTADTGGAYSNTWFRVATFQIEPRLCLLDLTDIFDDYFRALESIAKYCLEDLSNSVGIDIRGSLNEGALNPVPEIFKCFNVHDNGVSFHFAEHELSGKWLGAQSILVPYPVFHQFLNSKCAIASLGG